MSSEREVPQVDQLFAAFDFTQGSAANKRETEALLLAFIDVIDALQTLEAHYGELAATTTARIPVRGTSIIIKRALKAIGEAGVIPMDCQGQPLDLLFHEVAEVRPASGAAPDTILEELQRGYIWRNRVLRQARVAIAGQTE